MSENRPFFSLIIPCYNDGRYKAGQYLDKLLTSVVESNLSRDEIEIVLADDHSPKPYSRIINKFKKYFNIKEILTEYNFAPGNTRQVGTYVATGEWLCFADHDDTFYPRALRTVMDMIKYSSNDPIFVYADFDKVDPEDENKIVEKFYGRDNNALNFVHGKFYNRDRFWKPNKLAFPKDLRTHEDVALGHQVEVALMRTNPAQILHIPTPVYKWTNNPVSTSNTAYQDNESHTFLERAYKDYLDSSIGQYIERFKLGYLTPMELANKVIPIFVAAWAQLSQFKLDNPAGYIKENTDYLKDCWATFKEVSELKTLVIKMMMMQGMAPFIQKVNTFIIQNRDSLPVKLDDFDTWIDKLDRKEQNK